MLALAVEHRYEVEPSEDGGLVHQHDRSDQPGDQKPLFVENEMGEKAGLMALTQLPPTAIT